MLNAEELAEVARLQASGALKPASLVGELVVHLGPFASIAALFGPRRIRRFRIDEAGQLWIANQPVAWASMREVTFAFQFPFAATERDKRYGTVTAMSIVDFAGTRHDFARGQVFQHSPIRAPVLPYQLSDFLRAGAERSGMRVSWSSETNWIASR